MQAPACVCVCLCVRVKCLSVCGWPLLSAANHSVHYHAANEPAATAAATDTVAAAAAAQRHTLNMAIYDQSG